MICELSSLELALLTYVGWPASDQDFLRSDQDFLRSDPFLIGHLEVTIFLRRNLHGIPTRKSFDGHALLLFRRSSLLLVARPANLS